MKRIYKRVVEGMIRKELKEYMKQFDNEIVAKIYIEMKADNPTINYSPYFSSTVTTLSHRNYLFMGVVGWDGRIFIDRIE